jgi:hypothetical protein
MQSGHENFSSFFLYSGVLGHIPENTRRCCDRLRAMKPLFRDLKIQSTSPLYSWLDLHQSSFLNRVEAFNSSSVDKSSVKDCVLELRSGW